MIFSEPCKNTGTFYKAWLSERRFALKICLFKTVMNNFLSNPMNYVSGKKLKILLNLIKKLLKEVEKLLKEVDA